MSSNPYLCLTSTEDRIKLKEIFDPGRMFDIMLSHT
jgi:hypothetical protein